MEVSGLDKPAIVHKRGMTFIGTDNKMVSRASTQSCLPYIFCLAFGLLGWVLIRGVCLQYSRLGAC